MPRVWQAGGCVAFRTHPPHHHSSLQASGRAVDQSASDCQRGAWGAPPVSAYNYGRGGVMNGAGAVRVQLAALTDARICPMRASLAAAALSPASADKRMFVGGRTRCCSRGDGMWTHDPLTLPRMVTQSSVAVAICLLPRGDLPCCGVSARELSLFTANHSPPRHPPPRATPSYAPLRIARARPAVWRSQLWIAGIARSVRARRSYGGLFAGCGTRIG